MHAAAAAAVLPACSIIIPAAGSAGGRPGPAIPPGPGKQGSSSCRDPSDSLLLHCTRTAPGTALARARQWGAGDGRRREKNRPARTHMQRGQAKATHPDETPTNQTRPDVAAPGPACPCCADTGTEHAPSSPPRRTTAASRTPSTSYSVIAGDMHACFRAHR
jgi:hypothetical protein